MKTQIILLVFLFLLVNVHSNNLTTQNFKNTESSFSNETIFFKANDSLKKKKKRPYKIKKGYARMIKKIGEGNMIVFVKDNENTRFEDPIRFKSTSGFQFTTSNKKGFENVKFPVTLSIHNYKKRKYSNEMGREFNFKKTVNYTKTFEIQINEPGIWEITLETHNDLSINHNEELRRKN